MPNPNVLLEYGFALHVLSDTFLIAIMNTAYGAPENLPFDMGHRRHPLKYDFPPTASRADWRAIATNLAVEFEAILRPTIEQARSNPRKNSLFEKYPSSMAPAFFFPRGTTIASYDGDTQEYQFDGESAIYLRLYPKFRDKQPSIGRALLKDLFNRRRVIPFSRIQGGLPSANDYGWVIIGPASNNTTRGMTQGLPKGEIWGVNSEVFVQYRTSTLRGDDQILTVLPIVSVEQLYVNTLEDYVRFAISDLELQLPLVIEIGAVGLKGVFISAPNGAVTLGNFYGPFRDDQVVREYEVTDLKPETNLDVLRRYFDELYDCAECVRSKVLSV